MFLSSMIGAPNFSVRRCGGSPEGSRVLRYSTGIVAPESSSTEAALSKTVYCMAEQQCDATVMVQLADSILACSILKDGISLISLWHMLLAALIFCVSSAWHCCTCSASRTL